MDYMKKRYVKRVPQKKVYKKKVSKDVIRTMKSLISRQIEVKSNSHGSGLVGYNSGITVAGDVNRLLPYIVQGTDSGQRVSSKITAKSLVLKGHMFINQTFSFSTANARIGVRMMIVEPHQYPYTTDAINQGGTWLPRLLTSGNGEFNFDGSIPGLYLDMCKKTCKVHYDKIIYLTMPVIIEKAGTTNTTTTVTQDLRSSVAFFDINIPCKGKKLLYNDSSDNLPTNFGPVVLYGYANLDGTAADVLSSKLLVSSVATLSYEDI